MYADTFVLLHIKQECPKIYTVHVFTPRVWAKNVDPDQMPQNVTSDQILYCLPLIQKFKYITK